MGVPGAGKTTVGGLLATDLGAELIQTDTMVSAVLGVRPEEAFADAAGERHYREAEVAACLEALQRPGVIDLGSGAIEAEAVREALADHQVVWLRTSIATATRRLGMNLLGIEVLVAVRARLDAQLEQRAGWYATVATEAVDTDRRSATEVAAAIKSLIWS